MREREEEGDSEYWIFKSPEIKSYTACTELDNFYLNKMFEFKYCI